MAKWWELAIPTGATLLGVGITATWSLINAGHQRNHEGQMRLLDARREAYAEFVAYRRFLHTTTQSLEDYRVKKAEIRERYEASKAPAGPPDADALTEMLEDLDEAETEFAELKREFKQTVAQLQRTFATIDFLATPAVQAAAGALSNFEVSEESTDEERELLSKFIEAVRQELGTR